METPFEESTQADWNFNEVAATAEAANESGHTESQLMRTR
jgi:hypothetical protein